MPTICDPRIDPSLVPDGSIARVINGPDKEYLDLPCVIASNGQIITRWALSDEERAAIVRGEDIFVTLLVDLEHPYINPMFVTVGMVNWNELRTS